MVGRLDDGRLEVDGWLCRDWNSAVADVQRIGRPISELHVGASMLDSVPADTVPPPQPAVSTQTRVGLALLRDLVATGQLVHDEITGDIDEAFAATQVRTTMSGLILTASPAPHPGQGCRLGRRRRSPSRPSAGGVLRWGCSPARSGRPTSCRTASDPASAAPNTVGPPNINPGDPHGVTFAASEDNPGWFPPRITPSPWSGWPGDWSTPYWSSGGIREPLTDTAWMCVDFNANQLSAMPPYLKDAAPTLTADWLNNPDPDVYSSWEEFAKQLFWDYQLGEAFVLTTARYSTGWPARFHVVPPWMVAIDIENGERRYSIGDSDVTDDLLHVRYQSQVGFAHGVGPLDAGRYRMVAAQMLIRYGTTLVAGGGIPAGVLQHPLTLTREQAVQMQSDWVQSRLSTLGEPAVLSGGMTWKPTQVNPFRHGAHHPPRP